MQPSTDSSASDSHRSRSGSIRATMGVLMAAAALLAAAFAVYGPIAQPADYHTFADTRTLFGAPYFMDVASNLLFVLAGVWGLAVVWRNTHPQGPRLQRAWLAVFAVIVCTGFGSAYYHWAPDNWGLLIDRIPIAWACGLLMCVFAAERFRHTWAHPAVLAITLLVCSLAPMYWYATARVGTEDLRLYLYLQLLPITLIPLALLMRAITQQAPPGAGAVAGRDWFIVIGFYMLAKLFELTDREVFDALGIISGHTLKHVWAAAAAAWLVAAYRRVSRGS